MPTPEISRTVDQRLYELYERHLPLEDGSLVRYYQPGRGYYAPESAGQEAREFAVSLVTADGELYEAGDREVAFALQSVSKVLAYGLALEDHGRDEVLRRVGVEPSGEAFNSIAFDELNRRPFNPMVNAGALVTTDLIRGRNPEEKLGRILTRLRRWADNLSLEVHRAIPHVYITRRDHVRASGPTRSGSRPRAGSAARSSPSSPASWASGCSRRGSISSATASVASGSARRPPSDSACTSSPPKPKTPCSDSHDMGLLAGGR